MRVPCTGQQVLYALPGRSEYPLNALPLIITLPLLPDSGNAQFQDLFRLGGIIGERSICGIVQELWEIQAGSAPSRFRSLHG